MISITQQLTDNGYKFYKQSHLYTLYMTDMLYQKAIKDDEGNKKYFVNAFYHPARDIHGTHLNEVLQFEAHLRQGTWEEGELWVKIEPMTDDLRVAEEVIEKAWQALGMGFVEEKGE